MTDAAAKSSSTTPSAAARGSSMSLLDRIVADALEPAYAQRAQRTSHARVGRVGGARRAVHLGVVLIMVVAGFVVALAVTDVRRGAPAAAAARQALVTDVKARTAATDALASQVETLHTQVSGERDSALAATRAGRARASALAQLELVTGATAVHGPGMTVTVQDAPLSPQSSTPGEADLGTVQDRDLQTVVNGLWAAGAEAVSVGGYRVTAQTAIRTAGEAILVDFRPISEPYVIAAIGDPRRLRAAFLDGSGGRALSTLAGTYGIRFSTASAGHLTLPAAVELGDPDISTSSARTPTTTGGSR